jgi:hypothetical protein
MLTLKLQRPSGSQIHSGSGAGASRCNAGWRFSPQVAADVQQFLFHPTQTLEDRPDSSLIVRFRAGGALAMCWELFKWRRMPIYWAPRRLRDLFRQLMVKASRTSKATFKSPGQLEPSDYR